MTDKFVIGLEEDSYDTIEEAIKKATKYAQDYDNRYMVAKAVKVVGSPKAAVEVTDL
jgi:hypothetical protein